MILPEALHEKIKDQFLRRVFHHVDLLKDHIALALYFIRREYRVQNDIRYEVKGKRKVLIQDLGIKSDVFLFRKCVQLAADGINHFGDFAGRTLPRALEKQVLDKMRNAGIVRLFETRSAFDPDAQGHGAQMRHDLGCDHQAILHFPFLNIHCHSSHSVA